MISFEKKSTKFNENFFKKQKMNVLLINLSENWGALEETFLKDFKSLEKLKCQVSSIVFENSIIHNYFIERKKQDSLISLSLSKSFQSLRLFFLLRKLTRKKKLDVLIIYGLDESFVPVSLSLLFNRLTSFFVVLGKTYENKENSSLIKYLSFRLDTVFVLNNSLIHGYKHAFKVKLSKIRVLADPFKWLGANLNPALGGDTEENTIKDDRPDELFTFAINLEVYKEMNYQTCNFLNTINKFVKIWYEHLQRNSVNRKIKQFELLFIETTSSFHSDSVHLLHNDIKNMNLNFQIKFINCENYWNIPWDGIDLWFLNPSDYTPSFLDFRAIRKSKPILIPRNSSNAIFLDTKALGENSFNLNNPKELFDKFCQVLSTYKLQSESSFLLSQKMIKRQEEIDFQPTVYSALGVFEFRLLECYLVRNRLYSNFNRD